MSPPETGGRIALIRSLALLAGLLTSHPVLAGDARLDVRYHPPALVMEATDADGQPLSFAEVRIHAPSDPEVEFQTGRTDPEGKFAFIPSETGQWVMGVNLPNGRWLHALMVVPPELLEGEGGPREGSWEAWLLVVGLAGLGLGIMASRVRPGSPRRSEDARLP